MPKRPSEAYQSPYADQPSITPPTDDVSPLGIILSTMRQRYAAGDLEGAIALARIAAPLPPSAAARRHPSRGARRHDRCRPGRLPTSELSAPSAKSIRADLAAWAALALAPRGHQPAAHHRLIIRELEHVAAARTEPIDAAAATRQRQVDLRLARLPALVVRPAPPLLGHRDQPHRLARAAFWAWRPRADRNPRNRAWVSASTRPVARRTGSRPPPVPTTTRPASAGPSRGAGPTSS